MSTSATAPDTAHYFGRGYYQLYRHLLLPEEQTAAEAEFLIRRLRPRTGARWLDLPCGFGRHLAALARLRPDLRLLGGELNADYLAEPGLARVASLVRCDMLRPPLAAGSLDAVLCLLNSFGYYPPRGRFSLNAAQPDDRHMLYHIARMLRRGGRLVLDLPNRRELLRVVAEDPVIRYCSQGRQAVERFAWDPASQCLHNRTQWSWDRHRQQGAYRLRLYTPAQIARLLAWAGLEPTQVYGDFTGGPFEPNESDRMLILARKPR